MTVRRIVMNIAAPPGEDGAAFYRDLLGLDLLMDLGWVTTWGMSADTPNLQSPPQISVASQGGSGTPVPGISVEVDDVDAVWALAQDCDYEIPYPLTNEPWGVRRFMVRDPFGTLVNILSHR